MEAGLRRSRLVPRAVWVHRRAGVPQRDDPAEVVILFEVNDLDRARELVGSDELREVMQSAGVVDQPDVYFLNDEDPTAA